MCGVAWLTSFGVSHRILSSCASGLHDGRGNGPAAPSLIPRPRDFTLGQFTYQSTPADQPPSEPDLTQVVLNGLQASAMPYWHDLLSERDIREVVA
jgi:hypothetical protein